MTKPHRSEDGASCEECGLILTPENQAQPCEPISRPSPWRPIADYPITPDPDGAMGPIVLARDSNRFPLLVVMQRGHFYVVPGIPLMVGDRKGPSMMTVANLVDFMPLPD